MKKTLAILLCLALVICMIPATASVAFAATTPNFDLSKATITLSQDTYLYDNTAKEPVVTVKDGDNLLEQGKNYTVSYSNNTAAGTATVTITGKGTAPTGETSATEYYGTVEKNFTINKLDLANVNFESTEIVSTDIDMAKKTLNNIGKAKIKLKGSGITTEALMGLVDINSEYKAATSSAPASVIVSAVAKTGQTVNVINSRTTTYVVKTDISSGFTASLTGNLTFTYNGSAQVPNISYLKVSGTVNETAVNLSSSSDYTVTYSNNINGGTYANATITGRGNYTGSFVVNGLFYINPKQISNTSIDVSTALSGGTPTVTIKDGSNTLALGTDYTVQNSGANTVQITGINNYTGSVSRTFTVADKTLDRIVYSGGTQYYNGATQHANISVIGSDGASLTRGTDYTIKYNYTDPITNKSIDTDSPKDSAPYTFTVIGKGRYAGTLLGSFTITPVPLDWAEIVLGSSTVLNNGVYVPKVTVKHIGGGYYFPERDYTVTYRNVGTSYYYSKPTAVVTAVPGGNLSGSGSTKAELTKEFSLASRNLSNCTVTFTDSRSSKNYDGNASFKPPVTVKDYSINKTLTENLDYKITYKDAAGKVVYALKDAGTYSVIVEGINAYTGTKTLTFTINGTDISGYTVTLKESSVNATGYAQTPVITSVKKGYYSSLTSSDYTVSYQDSTGKTVTSMSAPGTYKVVVTGKNGYSGSTYATFRIVGLPQSMTVNQDSYKVYPTSDPFKITAKATGDGTGFTYTSSNPAVASVSSTGVVTMHKVGKAVIRVTTTGNKKYEPAYKDVTVKVYPKKTVLAKKPWTDGKKAQLKVRWNYQDGATKYQIRYSRDKNFKAGTYLTKTVKAHGKDYTTQSTTLTKLKSGYTYYIKVRAVYTDPVTGDNYYGSWSGWRSAKTI